MRKRLCERCRFYKKQVILVVFIALLWHCSQVCVAASQDLPKEVFLVKNEKSMVKKMVEELNNHKARMAFYYPGIDEDFSKYKRISPSYRTFFEQVAKRDGYAMGIVSGFCVTIKGEDTKYVVFQFSYLTTKRQEKKIDRRVKRIVKSIGKGSRLTKIKKAHDYLIRYMSYDERYYSPYDAFVKKKGLCMSYALAYQRLMQAMDIPCIYIKGDNHAWNMVKIGGYWYNVDVTWDDVGKGSYRYFLKSDADFPKHRRPASRWYASLQKAQHSYPLSY